MNSQQQREQFTVRRTLEKRCDDIATVIEGLAGELVRDRGTADDRMQAVAALFATVEQDATERWLATAAATKRGADTHNAFVRMTLWQRLRWIVVGA